MEDQIIIRGVVYKICFDKGETILKRFDKKHKTWVTLRFAENDDSKVLDNIQNMASNILTN
jgi:hypothetical protein